MRPTATNGNAAAYLKDPETVSLTAGRPTTQLTLSGPPHPGPEDLRLQQCPHALWQRGRQVLR